VVVGDAADGEIVPEGAARLVACAAEELDSASEGVLVVVDRDARRPVGAAPVDDLDLRGVRLRLRPVVEDELAAPDLDVGGDLLGIPAPQELDRRPRVVLEDRVLDQDRLVVVLEVDPAFVR
jgi:hypothetical protein